MKLRMLSVVRGENPARLTSSVLESRKERLTIYRGLNWVCVMLVDRSEKMVRGAG
jgi:hypothetical protein